MCMKKHKTYRPKGLSKEEQKYLDSMVRREVVMSIFVMIMGALVIVALFMLTKQAAGL